MGDDDTRGACPNLSFDFPIYDHFFDETKARGLVIDDIVGGGTLCGVQVVNDVFGSFAGELRFEAQIGSFLSLIIFVMLLQLGGIPIPEKSNKLSQGLYFTWMGVVSLQMLTLPLSIITLSMAYVRMEDDLKNCAVEWGHGFDMINIVSFPTFVYQPSFLKLILLWSVYWAALIEGVKVYCGAMRITPVMSLKMGGCCGPKMEMITFCAGEPEDLTVVGIDQIMVWFFSFRILLPPGIFCFLLWFMSCSWLFGIIFFLPLCLFAVAMQLIILKVLFMFYRSILRRSWPLLRPVKSMLWWVESIVRGDNTFIGVLITIYPFLALSPLVVYGTWTAAYIYAGHSTAENMEMIADAYKFTFASFTGLPAYFQMFSAFKIFDLRLALSDLVDFSATGGIDYTAEEYLAVSLALDIISSTLSIVKTVVAFICLLLATKGKVAKPIPFSCIAPTNLDNGTHIPAVVKAIAEDPPELLPQWTGGKTSILPEAEKSPPFHKASSMLDFSSTATY
jgi:hypothetical protein